MIDMARGKALDNVSMDFTNAPDPAAAAAPSGAEEGQQEAWEEIKFENVKVAEKNADGSMRYYDTNGKLVSDRVLNVLLELLKVPEFSAAGAEKRGEIFVREVDYKVQGDENVSGDTQFVQEKQYYEDDDSWDKTFLKSQYTLLKYLRSLEDGQKDT